MSGLEKILAVQIAALDLPEPVSEYRFHPQRRWRFDFAWPDLKLAVEVHGAIYAHGRHTRGKGFENDRRKVNEAQRLGWIVLEVTRDMIWKCEAIEWIAELIGKGERNE